MKRSDSSERAEDVANVAKALGEARMHISQDGRYVKHFGRINAEASKRDSELAAEVLVQAAEYSGDIALITADSDIINIIRNFSVLSTRKYLPPSLRSLTLQANVGVYSPSSTYFVPRFVLL